MKKMFSKKGQSTLEYVIVLMAILIAVIVGAKFFAGVPDDEHTNGSGLAWVLGSAGTRMTSAVTRIASLAE
jgi:uncharacterized protein (UPF0333 family)